jgi:ribosomal protein S18 acetylase RimI-like enzyme
VGNTSSNDAETELPVQGQLEAYNARDIDAFMRWWADDCQYYEFPSRLIANGAAEIRERHVARFKEPNLHGALVKRITVANLVVDHETVTRNSPDGPGEVDVVAIYEVDGGRIAKAWFKMGPSRRHSNLEIRRAAPSDALAVRELTRAAYSKWIANIGREPTPMTVDYDARVREHRIELLHVDGRLAALIELVPEAGHLLVENVAVLPAYQGRGYGRRLLTHAEAVAASLGLSAMRLYTNPLFAGNVQLYRRLGYQVDREEPFKGGVTVYMSKQLTPARSPLTNAIRAGLCRANSADASTVRDLVRKAYAKWVPLLGREPKPMTADYDVAVRDHVVNVLRLDGKAAALIEMEPGDDHLLVVNVAVSPDYQGRGYGRALLAHAEEFAISLGLKELRLYTSIHLTENVKLYERVGYKVDREEEASPHLGVFVHMSKCV